MSRTSLHNLPLHLIAWLTAVATFPLIFMGGLVTTHGAGMAVPDWPNSYGYNMVLFPPSQWIGGIWYEHVHRLYATGVGYLAVLLTLFAWGPAHKASRRRWLGWAALACAALTVVSGVVLVKTGVTSNFGKHFQHVAVGFGSLLLVFGAAWLARTRESRRWVRWLAVGVLGAVIVQGVLGGLRVVMVELDLAIVHGCFAQLYFCLTALMVAVTSRWWVRTRSASETSATPDRRLITACGLAVSLIFAQLIVGALMRHYGAGLAIPDLPLAYGKVLPPTSEAGLAEINAHRAWQLHMKPVTLGQVWLHMGHRIGALLVTAAVAWLAARVFRRHRGEPALVWPAAALTVLITAQFTLGVLTVLQGKPADIASLHVATGALTLVTTFILLVRSIRLFGGRPGEATVVRLSNQTQDRDTTAFGALAASGT